MSRLLDYSLPQFEDEFRELLSSRLEDSDEITQQSFKIIREVKSGGDNALISLTKKLDGSELSAQSIQISQEEIETASATISSDCRSAIMMATKRIREYHQQQIPQNLELTSETGETLGWTWNPIDSVGIYVPGGSASYPSSVLMNAIPAKVAGVNRITMAVPAPKGVINPLVLYAAKEACVDTILRIGGAQAIAALAFGTETIKRVDKITGPGNAYVTAAKRLVYGDVGIDMVAGPSEITIIADNSANPTWIAADILAQAEHDTAAQSILVTPSSFIASETAKCVKMQLSQLPRQNIASKSWGNHGATIVVQNLQEAVDIVNRIAPEHLQICTKNPNELRKNIRHAGAIFLGSWAPEAIGDYIAGASHVLPTQGTARFASGLSVLDFMKRTSITQMTSTAFARIAPSAKYLAISEGLDAHAHSLQLRLNSLDENNYG